MTDPQSFTHLTMLPEEQQTRANATRGSAGSPVQPCTSGPERSYEEPTPELGFHRLERSTRVWKGTAAIASRSKRREAAPREDPNRAAAAGPMAQL